MPYIACRGISWIIFEGHERGKLLTNRPTATVIPNQERQRAVSEITKVFGNIKPGANLTRDE